MSKLRFSRELVASTTEDIVADGIEAERLGFDSVWVPDHLVDIEPPGAMFDAWTMMGYIGAKTQRIGLGSGVTDALRIHPAKIANMVSTLDNLTNGRAILGIGSGEIMNTRPFGIAWEDKAVRVSRLREAIALIKLLWSSSAENKVSYSGKYYSLDNAHLSLKPVRNGGPPIFVGSLSSKSMLRVVGELADGWYPGFMNSAKDFGDKVRIISEAAKASNRSMDDIDVIASIPTIICTNDRDKAKAKVEIKNALKRNLVLYQYLFNVLGFKEMRKTLAPELDYQFATPGKEYEKSLAAAVKKLSIPDDAFERIIDDFMAVGSVDECLSSIERFVRAGATHIFFAHFLSSRENYKIIACEIIPRLRS